MESICFASFRSNASRRTKETSQNISKANKTAREMKKDTQTTPLFTSVFQTSQFVCFSLMSLMSVTFVSDRSV